ncbi:carbohydrate sulfotransferase 11 isoform X2 [Cimex lectularius]|nr:carbohydrate sulfotransferase 11 isoform X2 [Cimex lectularius]
MSPICRPYLYKRLALAVSLFICWLLLTGLFMHKKLTDFKPEPIVLTRNTSTARHEHHQTLEDVASLDNAHRLKRIKDVCTKYNIGLYQNASSENKSFKYPPAPQYSVFYYNMHDNLSICPVYKAGSSTWLFNLCILGGESETGIKNSKEQLSTIARRIYPELEYDQAVVVLPNTKKLMMVRHPFDRLLSAYRDKLENINIGREHGTHHFYRKYGAKIVQKYRKGGDKMVAILKPGSYYLNPKHPKPTGIEPTFEEFVRYLINTDLLNYADDHWIPYNMFCTPCLVEYDYINKVETMERDQMFVIKDAQLGDKIKPSWIHKTSPLEVSKEHITKLYFSQLTRKQIKELYKKFELDFEMFDYSPDKYYLYAKS